MSNLRQQHLSQFYDLMKRLESKLGLHFLRDCNGRMQWPSRGVYFFFDACEIRTNPNAERRIIRIGTHALKKGSKTTLWKRLSQHKGQIKSGGGNHRGSIFRLLVGDALIRKSSLSFDTWGSGNTASREIRDSKLALEQQVSAYIGNLPFLWLAIEDASGPESLRGYIERNSIALVSNFQKPAIDNLSNSWLGHFSSRPRVRESELWNQNHVDEIYDPAFPATLENLIDKM